MEGINPQARVGRLVHKIQQFWRLPRADRHLLLRIAFLVPLTEVALHVISFKSVLTLVRIFAVAKEPAINHSADVRRHARLVLLFGEHLPFAGKCLARSLVLWYLLQRRGIQSELRFGIQRQAGQLLAHAWIEYNSQPLEPTAHSFEPFAGSIVAAVPGARL
jgi:transglutaminase superfamily protein